MPEHLRALIVIIFIAAIMLTVAKHAFANIVENRDFNRRAILWGAITLILFFSQNFWLYIIGSALAIQLAKSRETNYVALFFILLFVTPPFSEEITGLGVIEHLFSLSHVRLLELIILLPASIVLFRQNDTVTFGRTTPDKFLIAYVLLTLILLFREMSITNIFRSGFYMYIDTILPYYVISRGLRNTDQFRDAITAFVTAAMIIAGVALFEYLVHWLLYSSVATALGVGGSWSFYLMRAGDLRAVVTSGQSIVLGYMLMTALGFYMYLHRSVANSFNKYAVIAILSAGLMASLSRGPWVGMCTFIIIFIWVSPKALSGMVKVFIGVVFLLLLAPMLPAGEKLINLLPYVGSVDSGSISYREQLFDMGLILIKQNPWFGSHAFLDTTEMQSLHQGWTVIDIVNSYLGIALKYGLLSLTLFVGFFVTIMFKLYLLLRGLENCNDDVYLLGQTLLAILVSILVTITTVSSIYFIPVIYWSVAGMAVGYIQMVQRSQIARVNVEQSDL